MACKDMLFDCCIITSSEVGETAAGDQQSKRRASLHFKTLMLISRLNEHFPPQSEEEKMAALQGWLKRLNAVYLLLRTLIYT